MGSAYTSLRALIAAVQFATLQIKLNLLVGELERHYRPDQPRAPQGKPEGGQWVSDRVHVAVGPRCDGFSAGCQMGGTYGTTGMFDIFGKKFCRDCAIKFLGIQGLPYEEQRETLQGFDKAVRK